VRLHGSQTDRLDSRASCKGLDTPPDTAFDSLFALAAQVYNVPLAMVDPVDAELSALGTSPHCNCPVTRSVLGAELDGSATDVLGRPT